MLHSLSCSSPVTYNHIQAMFSVHLTNGDVVPDCISFPLYNHSIRHKGTLFLIIARKKGDTQHSISLSSSFFFFFFLCFLTYFLIQQHIYKGSGTTPVSETDSLVFSHSNSPAWDELFSLRFPSPITLDWYQDKWLFVQLFHIGGIACCYLTQGRY